MTAREYVQYMYDGRLERNAELGRRGIVVPVVTAPAVIGGVIGGGDTLGIVPGGLVGIVPFLGTR